MAPIPPAPVQKPSVGSDVKYLFQDMPVWGWLILLGGIGIVVYFFLRRGSSGGTVTGSLPVNTAAGTDTGIGPALTSDQTQWQGDFQALIDENSQILGLLQSGQSGLPSLSGGFTGATPPDAGGTPPDAGGGASVAFLGPPTPDPGILGTIGAAAFLEPSDQGNPGNIISDQPLNNGPSTGVGPYGNVIASIPLSYTGPQPSVPEPPPPVYSPAPTFSDPYAPVLPTNLPAWFVPFGSGSVQTTPIQAVQTGLESSYGTYPTASQILGGPVGITPTTAPAPNSTGSNKIQPVMV